MNKHLSDDQLALCLAGSATTEEQRHGRECPTCRTKLQAFDESLAAFRHVMQEVDCRPIPHLTDLSARPTASSGRMAAVTVGLMLVAAIPIHQLETELIRQVRNKEAARLMGVVDLHLSRTLPAPLEPALALIPLEQLMTNSGVIR